MENSKTKLSKGLKGLLVATIFVAVLFLAAYIVLAVFAPKANDPDLPSILGVFKYNLRGILDLVLFRYASGSNIAYFALSVFMYALFVCWIIFLIAGIFINDRKNTRIMVHATILSFISFLIYVVMASGAQKYWQIMNSRSYYEDNLLLRILALSMVGLTALYFILSILFYFWCVVHAFLANMNNEKDEYVEDEPLEEKKVIDEEDLESKVRRIMKEELLNSQPFKVYVVNDNIALHHETKEVVPAPVVIKEVIKEVVPEVKEEPKKEVIKEEPKQVFPKVDFWKIAREVWPQIDNPKPLPKVEKVVVEEPVEEDEAWNRNKRQPFLTRILTADTDIKVNYNEIKNEILSYGVKARLSRGGETFRLKDKKYVKIYLVGKTLKVYLALSPEDYKDSTIPVEDVGHRPNYAEMPLLFKVRSGLSVRRCKELIKAAMEKDGLTQGEVKDINWVDELRKLNAEKAKNK